MQSVSFVRRRRRSGDPSLQFGVLGLAGLLLLGALLLPAAAGATVIEELELTDDLKLGIRPVLMILSEYDALEGGDDHFEIHFDRVEIAFDLRYQRRYQLFIELLPIAPHFDHNIEGVTLGDDTRLQEPTDGFLRGDPRLSMQLLGRAALSIRRLPGRTSISIGQMRTPFGFWNEMSLHRSSALTKVNGLVQGIPLKWYGIGAMVEGRPWRFLNYSFALFNGHENDTSIVSEEGAQETTTGHGHGGGVHESEAGGGIVVPDLVGRIGFGVRWLQIGVNGMLFGSEDKFALGVDLKFRLGDFTLIAETVFQQNQRDRLRSLAGYANLRYDLSRWLDGLRLFVLYDYWRLDYFEVEVGENHKAVGGARYEIVPGIGVAIEYSFHEQQIADQRRHAIAVQFEAAL